jgi:tetratricopeptide (TPR) repeat protein
VRYTPAKGGSADGIETGPLIEPRKRGGAAGAAMNRGEREGEVITMPSTKRTMACLLFSIVMGAGLALAQDHGRLIGKILDPQGNPLPGVVVTVTSPDLPKFKDVETTNKRGMFTVNFDTLDVTYQYRFDKVGYESMKVEQTWHLVGSQVYEWTMKPGQSAAGVAAGAPPASASEPAIAAFNAGVTALKAKDYATAEAKFNEAVKDDPKFRQAWDGLTVVQLQLGHSKEAAEAGDQALALGSTDQATLMARWQAYRDLKDETKAAEALKDLQRVGSQTEEAKKFHNEAVALLNAKDYAGAMAKFQEALKLDPNLQEAQLGLATAALELGHNAEAITAAEGVLKADPKNPAAIRIRYNAALALGDKAKLVDALVGLAASDPVRARDGLLKLAFDAYDANDMVQAKEMFGKALKVDPNYALAYYYLGLIAVGQGASADARSNLERFLQLAPNDKEADAAREMIKYLNKP